MADGAAEDRAALTGHRSGAWLWTGVLTAAVALVVHASVGLVAAMTGHYSTVPVLAVTVIGTAAAWPVVRRAVPTTSTTAASNLVMVVVALGTLAYSADNIGQHVVTRRDPGSYLTTARWLADHGELHVDAGDPVFAGVSDVRFTGPAVVSDGGSTIEFQFSHGAQTVMASLFVLGGSQALFVSSALVGALALLALYLALSSLSRSPWLAVAGASAFGVSLPFLFVTRNTYSEPFVLLLVCLALGLLLAAGRRPRPVQLFLCGAFVGATELFRIDARLYVIGLVLLASVLLLRGVRLATAVGMLACAAPFVAIAVVDVRVFAGSYAESVGDEVRALDLMTAAGLVLFVLVAFATRRWSLAFPDRPGRGAIATVAAVVVAVVGVLGWVVRPRVLPAVASWRPESRITDTVTRLQTALGLEVDPTRSYAESGIESIGWYLGAPMVAFAIAGFALVAGRIVREPRSRLLPPSVLLAVGVPYYLWDNRITPDQLWATRRFLPMILPAFVLGAVWAASHLVQVTPARWRRSALVATAAALVVPAVVATYPIRGFNDQRGNAALVETLCGQLGSDAVVLDLSDGLYAMTARAWCGTTVATIDYDDRDGVDSFLDAAAAACRPAFLIAQTDGRLAPHDDRLDHVVLEAADNRRQLSSTLDEAPDEYRVRRTAYRLGVAPTPPGCR